MAFQDRKQAFDYINQYKREKYDRINLLLPLGRKDVIKRIAADRGLSVNAFINAAIDEKLKRLGYSDNKTE